MDDKPILLGTASARRHHVLRGLGFPFDVATAETEEILFPGDPVRTAVENARRKFDALRPRFMDRWMLTADTVVFIDGACLGKPATVEEGVRMLRSYSNREQLVVTGMIFAAPHGAPESRAERSWISFGAITEADARDYLARFGTIDRAGAYDLDSLRPFVREIRGSASNIRGLPAETVRDWFAARGAPFAQDGRQPPRPRAGIAMA
ncbi:MAG: Maf family protein [Kiritimatiellia bacterium]|jgi:septum formation protein